MRFTQAAERRASRRRAGGDCAWLTSARLRRGLVIDVLNLSAGGALVEAEARLLPGTDVDLQLTAPGWRWFATARILRCHVSAVVIDHGVRYRAALRFQHCLELPQADQEPEEAEDGGSPETAKDRRDLSGSDYPRGTSGFSLRVATTRADGP